MDVSHADLKPAQRQGPKGRVRARGRISTAAPSHVVSIATAAPAAEPFPEDPPRSEVISVATKTSRAMAAQTGRFRRNAQRIPRLSRAGSVRGGQSRVL